MLRYLKRRERVEREQGWAQKGIAPVEVLFIVLY
jgi:hypothetical protein